MAITAIRTVLIYILIIVAMRIMGKRQLGELQPIELVVTLLISDLASVPMQDSGTPLLSGIIPIFILVALELLLSAIMLKSTRFSHLVSGNPIVVIQNGELQQPALKKLRMTVEDLGESLRQQGIFNPDDLEFALMEPSGHISVVMKPEKQSVTAEMAGLSPPPATVDMIIVSDGVPSSWALAVCGLDEKWLCNVLNQQQLTLKEIFLMVANQEGTFRIIKREEP